MEDSEAYHRIHALMVFGRDDLVTWLNEYFGMADTYHYNLTRCKSAFGIGTMQLSDFEEFDESDVEELADFLLGKLKTCE